MAPDSTSYCRFYPSPSEKEGEVRAVNPLTARASRIEKPYYSRRRCDKDRGPEQHRWRLSLTARGLAALMEPGPPRLGGCWAFVTAAVPLGERLAMGLEGRVMTVRAYRETSARADARKDPAASAKRLFIVDEPLNLMSSFSLMAVAMWDT